MSLVNDALKKARLEAARQDAARRGLPMPGAHLAGGSRLDSPRLPRVAVIGGVLVLALVLFFAGRRLTKVEEPQAATTEARSAQLGTEDGASAVASTPAETAPPPPPTPTQQGPAASTPRTAPSPADSSARTPTQPPTQSPASDAARTGSESQVAPPPPQASLPTAASAPGDGEPSPAESTNSPRRRGSQRTGAQTVPDSQLGAESTAEPTTEAKQGPAVRIVSPNSARSVVRVLELPSGVRIELGGIAWSKQRPFALLNGRVVGPGDGVESMTVVAIAPRHVELKGDAGHFLLQLK